MLGDSIQELVSGSLARIRAARTLEELEAARVEVLGRKGTLTLAQKEIGKLAPADRPAFGQILNGVLDG